jgi:CheY-like chemotaxis protein
LVVEDDALLQLLVCETLVLMGHQVCDVAASEIEAIEAEARSRPDLMIVDLHLETGSGLSAVRRIWRVRPIPHILVSGEILAADQLDPGAVTLLKPYQDAELELAIARAMARSRARPNAPNPGRSV